MKSKKNKSLGFTLIELLVVISIIAILMAIMVPALKRAREVAQNTICKSNLRGIGLAALLWSEDNDGWSLPGMWDREHQDSGRTILKPYLGDADSGDGVGLCPSVPTRYAGKTYGDLGLTADVAGLANSGNYYSSYGLNGRLCSRTDNPLGTFDTANDNNTQWGRGNIWFYKRGHTKIPTVRKPAEKVMFAESLLYVTGTWLYNRDMLNPAFKDPAERGFRHFPRRRSVIGTSETEMAGSMNITWIDGSVTEHPDDFEEPDPSGRGYRVASKFFQGF